MDFFWELFFCSCFLCTPCAWCAPLRHIECIAVVTHGEVLTTVAALQYGDVRNVIFNNSGNYFGGLVFEGLSNSGHVS